jgi:hypothetical protein
MKEKRKSIEESSPKTGREKQDEVYIELESYDDDEFAECEPFQIHTVGDSINGGHTTTIATEIINKMIEEGKINLEEFDINKTHDKQ